MSKYWIRLLVVAIVISATGLVWAQKRSVVKTPTRSEEGKVASVEEPDFTRFRVVTTEGIFVVFDAAEDWNGRPEPASQLAYWHDFASEQLLFFDQLLFTSEDVLQSAAAMVRDLAIDHALLIAEKPELSPLPEINSPGQWRPAVEGDVLAVMSGGQAAAVEDPSSAVEGTVSGLMSPCAPNPNCDPAAAASASSSIPSPVRGTPQSQLFAMAQGASYCNCGGGSPPPPPADPLRFIHPIADRLADMEEDLQSNYFDSSVCPFTEITAPVVTSISGTSNLASAPFLLHRGGEPRRTGSASIAFEDNGTSLSLQISTTFDDGVVGDDPQWSLTQTIQLIGDTLSFDGSIGVIEPSGNSYSLPGGWTYSATTGPVLTPASNTAFQSLMESMLGFGQPTVARSNNPFGPVLSSLSNMPALLLNYLRDLRIPYRAPGSCSGPFISDATSGCEDDPDDISCRDNLTELALDYIDALSDGTVGFNLGAPFKKCMSGRFGCKDTAGRTISNHRKLNFKCIFPPSNCGPCGPNPVGNIGGCNLGGRTFWYCGDPDDHPCFCAQIVFHEAAHACGIGHSLPYFSVGCQGVSGERACLIGEWFQSNCCQSEPSTDPFCHPSTSAVINNE